MRSTIATAAIAAMVLGAGSAMAGATPEQRCEAAKNDAAGKYDACAAKAEKLLVSTGNATKYADALLKCENKLVSIWGKLEAAAADAGTACPSTGDRAAIQDFVDACVQSVAVAVGGGILRPDPVACSADLGDCNTDLATCTGGLGTCTANLASCNGNLASTSANLATCSGNLSTCMSELSTTNADLTSCIGDMATAGAGTAAVGHVLSGKTFTSAAGLGATGTMPNNGGVTLTPTMSDQAIAAGYHDGSGKCSGDADLVAANVRNGVNLFGVAGTVGLQKTGQTSCYDSSGLPTACPGTGQDGQLQKGAARSFTDNGDGTVTDNLTGLMWEKQSDDDGIHDKDNTYTWGNTFALKVAALNAEAFAGYRDWRVPNVVELESLRNFGTTHPSTFAAFNNNCTQACTVLTCSCTRSHLYWSSSTYLNTPTQAWFVGFSVGYTYMDYKANNYGLRAVRAGA